MKTLFRRYRVNGRRLENQGNPSFFISIKVVLTALFFSSLITALPLLLWINLLIFYDLRILFGILIIAELAGGMFLYMYFYYEALKAYVPAVKDIKTWPAVIIEGGIMALVIIIIGIFILTSFV